jgi:hypothetical protein
MVVSALTLTAGVIHAQIWRGGYGGYAAPRFPTAKTFTGAFNFCRIMFASDWGNKGGWSTDYPGAEINFSVRLSELTKTRVGMNADGGEGGDPDYVVVRLTDDALFQCPFVMVEDAGGIRLSEIEVTRLREYLLKGGFLLVADYWGTLAQREWDARIARVLPPARYPITAIPADHPMWRTLLEVKQLPQIPSIQFWRRSGGQISEQGTDSEHPDARVIADERGRFMVVMLHNTDIPDGWEREAADPEYFYRFSPDAYAVGINLMMYAMTH